MERAAGQPAPVPGRRLAPGALRRPAARRGDQFIVLPPHQRSTYERWAASTPPAFRFSVKLPRSITHTARLKGTDALLEAFLAQAQGLGERLGCLLVQLPPSLRLDRPVAEAFLRGLRERHPHGSVAVEPRHASWFTPEGDALLRA